MSKIQIAVAYHKNSDLIANECLLPIHVGKACSEYDLMMIGDDTANNISHKNFGYAELTAIYWLWKNSNADIKGLFHYRRFLDLNSNSLYKNSNFYEYTIENDFSSQKFLDQLHIDTNRIQELMSQYDIITRKKEDIKDWSNHTIKSHYIEEHHGEHLEITIGIIHRDYPEYYQTAVNLVSGSQSYFTNMIIMNSQTYDNYCNWLFDILDKVENKINLYDKSLAPNTSKARWAGFLGERLTAIYIQKAIESDKKVMEVPAVILTPANKKWYECSTYDSALYNNLNRLDNNEPKSENTFPKISIILPTYNVDKFIDLCLQSIKNQTFSNYEVIIIDKGSTDKTQEIIDQYAKQDKRFICLINENQNIGYSCKQGIEKANGEYICFMNSGDLMEKNFLEMMLKSSQKFNSDIVISEYKCIDESTLEHLYSLNLPHTLYGVININDNPDILLVCNNIRGKIYKKDLIQPNFLIKDDDEGIYFWWNLILVANRISFDRNIRYSYRVSTISSECIGNIIKNAKLAQDHVLKQPIVVQEYFELFKYVLIGHILYRAKNLFLQDKFFTKKFLLDAQQFLNSNSIEISPKIAQCKSFFYTDFDLLETLKDEKYSKSLLRKLNLIKKDIYYYFIKIITFGKMI
ncbi:DUF4422 domain-containing protein [Orbus sturtevantii]|uniref:DUF4422 domain-containing protein n=1 Tax=Orbus sturtevantii TaxID=3074109 RepID=UPI00370D5EFA